MIRYSNCEPQIGHRTRWEDEVNLHRRLENLSILPILKTQLENSAFCSDLETFSFCARVFCSGLSI